MKKYALTAVVGLTLINALIFAFRDHFHYKPYASHQELYERTDETRLKQWQEFFTHISPLELKEAKRITDSILSGRQMTTQQKAMHIGQFIHQQFFAQTGQHTAQLPTSPLTMYQQLRKDRSLRLLCGDYAHMFALFAWSQGILARYIEMMDPEDRHVVNEYYSPEDDKWILIDPTFGMLTASNPQQTPLNLQTFYQSLKKADKINICSRIDTICKSEQLDTNAFFIQNYYAKGLPSYYVHTITLSEVYKPENKIKRYFSSDSWYDIFDVHPETNWPFYTKIGAFILWLAAVGFLILVVLKRIQ